jgi:hypothetical protein
MLQFRIISEIRISLTFGRIPLTGDQRDAGPLPIQDSTARRMSRKSIHALNEIRINDSSIQGAKMRALDRSGNFYCFTENTRTDTQ